VTDCCNVKVDGPPFDGISGPAPRDRNSGDEALTSNDHSSNRTGVGHIAASIGIAGLPLRN
jgi:hypothetical protein